MKKAFVIALSLMLVGCSSTSQSVDVTKYEEKISSLEKQLEEANNKIKELESGQVVTNTSNSEKDDTPVSNSENNIKGLTVVSTKMEAMTIDTYEGQKNVLRVDFDFTNNSEETATFDGMLNMKAFQDAVELNKVFNTETTGEYGDNSFKEVRPGGTISISILFETKSNNPMEVEVTELFSMDDIIIKLGTYEFK